LWSWGESSIEEGPEKGKEKPNFRDDKKHHTCTKPSLNNTGVVAFISSFAHDVAPPKACSNHYSD
jgi:hypothetical protein